MWDMTRWYVRHDSLFCETWLVGMWDMTRWYVRHQRSSKSQDDQAHSLRVSVFCVRSCRVSPISPAHSYVRHDSLIRETSKVLSFTRDYVKGMWMRGPLKSHISTSHVSRMSERERYGSHGTNAHRLCQGHSLRVSVFCARSSHVRVCVWVPFRQAQLQITMIVCVRACVWVCGCVCVDSMCFHVIYVYVCAYLLVKLSFKGDSACVCVCVCMRLYYVFNRLCVRESTFWSSSASKVIVCVCVCVCACVWIMCAFVWERERLPFCQTQLQSHGDIPAFAEWPLSSAPSLPRLVTSCQSPVCVPVCACVWVCVCVCMWVCVCIFCSVI